MGSTSDKILFSVARVLSTKHPPGQQILGYSFLRAHCTSHKTEALAIRYLSRILFSQEFSNAA